MKYLVYTLSIPICFSITSLIGILVTSASEAMYGKPFWSPLDVLGTFLNDYTPGIVLVCFSFLLLLHYSWGQTFLPTRYRSVQIVQLCYQGFEH